MALTNLKSLTGTNGIRVLGRRNIWWLRWSISQNCHLECSLDTMVHNFVGHLCFMQDFLPRMKITETKCLHLVCSTDPSSFSLLPTTQTFLYKPQGMSNKIVMLSILIVDVRKVSPKKVTMGLIFSNNLI